MPDYEKIAEGLESPELAASVREIAIEEVEEFQREFFPLDHPRYQGLAAAKGYDQSRARLVRTHYSHEAMIDVIIANPNITQNQLAEQFEKSVPWISRIFGSDAFQAALTKRREEITDPFLIATIEERFRGLAYQSLDIITEKLASTRNVDLALKGLDISAKSLGFGARNAGGNTQNTQFVIQLPPKNANAAEWAAEHSPIQIGGE